MEIEGCSSCHKEEVVKRIKKNLYSKKDLPLLSLFWFEHDGVDYCCNFYVYYFNYDGYTLKLHFSEDGFVDTTLLRGTRPAKDKNGYCNIKEFNSFKELQDEIYNYIYKVCNPKAFPFRNLEDVMDDMEIKNITLWTNKHQHLRDAADYKNQGEYKCHRHKLVQKNLRFWK